MIIFSTLTIWGSLLPAEALVKVETTLTRAHGGKPTPPILTRDGNRPQPRIRVTDRLFRQGRETSSRRSDACVRRPGGTSHSTVYGRQQRRSERDESAAWTPVCKAHSERRRSLWANRMTINGAY